MAAFETLSDGRIKFSSVPPETEYFKRDSNDRMILIPQFVDCTCRGILSNRLECGKIIYSHCCTKGLPVSPKYCKTCRFREVSNASQMQS